MEEVYQKMYLGLFNAVTRALDAMDDFNYGTARDILRNAQIQAEETYIEAETAEK